MSICFSKCIIVRVVLLSYSLFTSFLVYGPYIPHFYLPETSFHLSLSLSPSLSKKSFCPKFVAPLRPKDRKASINFRFLVLTYSIYIICTKNQNLLCWLLIVMMQKLIKVWYLLPLTYLSRVKLFIIKIYIQMFYITTC